MLNGIEIKQVRLSYRATTCSPLDGRACAPTQTRQTDRPAEEREVSLHNPITTIRRTAHRDLNLTPADLFGMRYVSFFTVNGCVEKRHRLHAVVCSTVNIMVIDANYKGNVVSTYTNHLFWLSLNIDQFYN
ncbi:hypothetical protein J6590_095994 [Homalodisca vitripennis]|nr:hypothetical protein J6590_095994 [Homalodisca vitripennis]